MAHIELNTIYKDYSKFLGIGETRERSNVMYNMAFAWVSLQNKFDEYVIGYAMNKHRTSIIHYWNQHHTNIHELKNENFRNHYLLGMQIAEICFQTKSLESVINGFVSLKSRVEVLENKLEEVKRDLKEKNSKIAELNIKLIGMAIDKKHNSTK